MKLVRFDEAALDELFEDTAWYNSQRQASRGDSSMRSTLCFLGSQKAPARSRFSPINHRISIFDGRY